MGGVPSDQGAVSVAAAKAAAALSGIAVTRYVMWAPEAGNCLWRPGNGRGNLSSHLIH